MEQAELHQKLVSLQQELTVLKQQYDSVLEQVGQQHSFIHQLQLQGTQNSGENMGCMQSEETETGECEL